MTASMAAARKPRCSSVRTPAIVVPAGLQTSAWSLQETDKYDHAPVPGSGAGAFAPVEAGLHRLVQGEDARIS